MMEKNIGIALHNKGKYAEATQYFDRTLAYYNMVVPKSQSRYRAIASFLVNILIAMYFPFFKWRKTPTDREVEILKLLFLQLGDIGVSDSTRYLGATAFFFKNLTKFQIEKIKDGSVMLVGAAVGFTYKGISIALSDKIMSFLKDKVDREYTKDMIFFAFSNCMNDRLKGRWNNHRYDKTLVENALKKGEIQCVCWYLINDFFIHLGKGEFVEAEDRIMIFYDISRQFDHLPAKGYALGSKSKLLVRQRKINEAFSHLEQSINFYLKIDDKTQLYWLYSYLAYLQILVDDIYSAEKTLDKASNIKPPDTPKLYDTLYQLNRFKIDLHYLLKAKENNDSSLFSKSAKQALSTGKTTLKYCKVNADEKTEICKLMGNYYWLTDNHKKAFFWWKKSLISGKKNGALPEVGRTYLDVGRRIAMGTKNTWRFLELSSSECLALARDIFSKLELEWDLAEIPE